MPDRCDNHGGYGRCRGTGKVWVDDGEASNFYRSGSCPDCAPMPDRQTIADVEARLEKHVSLLKSVGAGADHAADLTALLASHRRLTEQNTRLADALGRAGWPDLAREIQGDADA